MKIVFDAECSRRGFCSAGTLRRSFRSLPGSYECTASAPILAETEDALRRKIHLPAPRAAAIRGFLEEHLRLVTPVTVEADSCRDRDDLLILGTALAAGADCIVSGDKDLLVLGSFRGIAILKPRALWDRISSR